MRQFSKFITAALFVMMAVTACGMFEKYDDSEIRERLDKLEGSTINTISQQISAIENTIKILQKSDTVYESEIKTLQAYVDECRGSDKNWVETTFATLAQYNSIMDSLTSLDANIEDAVISMQSWVNQALTGYYAIATADAKLAALESQITTVDSASTANIAKLQEDLLQAKTDLQDAYEKAITGAIETNNGIINKKIADEIEAVNTHIDTEINRIDKAIAELEGRISALETTVAELTKVLGIKFSEKNISCTSGDIVKIDYTITNSNGQATVYTLSENGYVSTIETKTATTGIITVNVPRPLVNGNVLVFVNEDNKSCIAALNFIEGSMTVSTDVVEVGAEGGEVSVDVDTDLGYTVKVQDDITWLHDATVTTRSAIRYEKVTLIADATQLAFPRNAVVYLLNAAGDILSQYTVRQAGTVSSHEYVDLGLSVMWATCNVGATRPEEYGDCFAWGETTSKSTYDWSTYKYCLDSYGDKFSKYVNNSRYGTVDNKTTLELRDDAARANWGGTWRMPTITEFDELINNCTWTWTTLNGINGYKVTSKMPGYTNKSIFLPATGNRNNVYLNNAGSNGSYWSSSLFTDFSSDAYVLDIYSDSHYRINGNRSYGRSVRPVCPSESYVSVTSVSLNTSSLLLEVNSTTALTVTVSPFNATDKSVQWSSSNTDVVTVDSNGKVTAKSAGTAVITVTTTDENITATCTVTVKSQQSSDGKENGHDYVDLGLSVKWATCNVDATRPEEYGDSFAWGETTSKSTYDWSTYKYCNGSYSTTMTKYCTSSSYGTVDNKTTLELSDDAAHANWGGTWRMPTITEFDELINNCTWTWATLNGVNGYIVISSISGYTDKSIFLPAAEWRDFDIMLDVGSSGFYWSSSLYSPYSLEANGLYFKSNNHKITSCEYRILGRYVRPVCPSENYVFVTSVSLNTSFVTLEVDSTTTLTATVSPSNATDKSVQWKSSNTTVATVDSNGKVTAKSAGTATITATSSDGNTTATCTVTVKSQQSSDGKENGHEYVDLGLPSGIKWATCNVGASMPEEYGNYFAWGETTSKSTYNWSTYKYCKGSSSTMTKYCTSSSYGTVDNKTTLEFSDDAARANWGGSWRMPTASDVDELLNNCTWMWTTQNGINGYKVTSNNAGYTNKSIFLPAAGYRYYDGLSNAGSSGYYWSSSLSTKSSLYTYELYFSTDGHYRSHYGRYYGRSVRPVCE